MNMIITIYANYGVLGREKQVVYSLAPINEAVSEQIRVDIPAAFTMSVNIYGERLISWNDDNYLLNDLLETDNDGNPCIGLPTNYAIIRHKLNITQHREENGDE